MVCIMSRSAMAFTHRRTMGVTQNHWLIVRMLKRTGAVCVRLYGLPVPDIAESVLHVCRGWTITVFGGCCAFNKIVPFLCSLFIPGGTVRKHFPTSPHLQYIDYETQVNFQATFSGSFSGNKLLEGVILQQLFPC